jgi:hypothetical protein
MRRSIPLLAALTVVLFATAATKSREAIWTAPDLARYDVRSIAFLPVSMYEKNAEQQRIVEVAVGQALKGTGYRFVSAGLARDWLAAAGGDSLLTALDHHLLEAGQVDSAQAPFLSRTTRARALLTVRVDRMEKSELEPDQSGKPTTSVQLQMALVDSTGALLWTAHGSETMEGPYQDAANGSQGVTANGLSTKMANAGAGGAPTYPEVLTKLLARWAPQFPARPPAAATN